MRAKTLTDTSANKIFCCCCHCCSVTKSSPTLCSNGLQHTGILCPPLSPRVFSNSCSLNQWCYLTISFSATPFSFCLQSFLALGFPGGTSVKESACQCRRLKRCQLDLWVGKIPWRRKWRHLQYSCLEKYMGRGAWWATVHGVAKSQTQLST